MNDLSLQGFLHELTNSLLVQGNARELAKQAFDRTLSTTLANIDAGDIEEDIDIEEIDTDGGEGKNNGTYTL